MNIKVIYKIGIIDLKMFIKILVMYLFLMVSDFSSNEYNLAIIKNELPKMGLLEQALKKILFRFLNASSSQCEKRDIYSIYQKLNLSC